MYISYSKMEILYVKEGREEIMEVSSGMLIVPPGVVHNIKLHGITFVFQAAMKGSKVHEDKEVRALGS